MLSFCKNDSYNGHGKAKQVIEKYPSGKVKMNYKTVNGKIDGIRNEYYENGTLKASENWHDSILSGVAKYYYPNGDLQQEGEFTKGRSSGCWYRYYPGKRLKAFDEYLFVDSIPILSRTPNRCLTFDSLGNVDLSYICIYYESKIVKENNKEYFNLRTYYVPGGCNYRIIYQTSLKHKLDTLEGKNHSNFMFPLESPTDYIRGDLQFYEDIEIKGEKFIRTFNSYFDSRNPTCNIKSWPQK